jgi:hypothetical protein
MFRVPLPNSPISRDKLLVHVEPVPVTVTVPVQPEKKPREPLKLNKSLPPFTVTVPEEDLPIMAEVVDVQVAGFAGSTSPDHTIAARAFDVTQKKKSEAHAIIPSTRKIIRKYFTAPKKTIRFT